MLFEWLKASFHIKSLLKLCLDYNWLCKYNRSSKIKHHFNQFLIIIDDPWNTDWNIIAWAMTPLFMIKLVTTHPLVIYSALRVLFFFKIPQLKLIMQTCPKYSTYRKLFTSSTAAYNASVGCHTFAYLHFVWSKIHLHVIRKISILTIIVMKLLNHYFFIQYTCQN